jgi:hypothetical protein
MLNLVSNSKAELYHLFSVVEGTKLEKLDTGGFKRIFYTQVEHRFYDSVVTVYEQDQCVVEPTPGYTRRKDK